MSKIMLIRANSLQFSEFSSLFDEDDCNIPAWKKAGFMEVTNLPSLKNEVIKDYSDPHYYNTSSVVDWAATTTSGINIRIMMPEGINPIIGLPLAQGIGITYKGRPI